MAPYTAADYTCALDSHEGRQGGFVGYQGVVDSALRIASRVMKPGVLEDGLAMGLGRSARTSRTPAIVAYADVIRRVLTGTTNV